MEKPKSILLKLTDDQFKVLAHAKVESGEKSWEAFVLRQNALQMTAKEYAVVKDGLLTVLDGYEGVKDSSEKFLDAKNVLEAIQSRYEGHPTTIQAEVVRRALAKELSPAKLPDKEDDQK